MDSTHSLTGKKMFWAVFLGMLAYASVWKILTIVTTLLFRAL